MTGPVFWVVLTVVGLALTLLVNVFILVPVVLIGLAALIAPPVLAAMRARGVGGAEPSGVPNTSQASYDPQATSRERATG